MGAVFDPRVKLQLLEYCYSKFDLHSSKEKVEKLKNKLYKLYDEYKERGVGSSFKDSGPGSQVGDSSNSKRQKNHMTGRGLDLDKSELDDYKSFKGGSSDTKTYLDKYMDEEQMNEGAEINVLQYWKDNSVRFGDLARLACDVLSIPITTVTSESSFSIEAFVLNKYRNRLLPEKVQALICTRNWLHGYPSDDEDDEFEDCDDDEAGETSSSGMPESHGECYSVT